MQAWIGRAWRRWRLIGAAHALACGAGLGLVAWSWLGGGVGSGAAIAVAVAAATALGLLGHRRFRDVRAALAAVEAHHPALGNALIAWHETHRSVPPAIAARLARLARIGLEGLRPASPFGARA